MISILRKLIRKTGFDIVRLKKSDDSPLSGLDDLPPQDRQILEECRGFTMTSPARMATLINATHHILENDIPGDFVECGVWRGGSMMIVAKALIAAGDTGRELYLFDTFEGMSEPTEADANRGEPAEELLKREPKGTGIWCHASIEDVRQNLYSTGYPQDKIHFVKGKVEDTIPGTIPEKIALLRLDTDWYESTKHEMLHLYPLIHESGVLIIDDYGFWDGAQKAVDEYFDAFPKRPFLHRIDATGTGRILVNPPQLQG